MKPGCLHRLGGSGVVRNWTHWLLKVQLFWLLLALAAGLGFRAALLPWRPAMTAVALAGCGLVLTGFFSLLVLYAFLRANRRGSGRHCLLAVALSLPALACALWLGVQGSKVPPIHDITTDTDTPPSFFAASGLRQAGDNSLQYPGRAVAEQQRRAYPHIVPLEVPVPPAEAFARSLAVAARLQWHIVGQDQGQGRIEAVSRTRVFGFADDIVIRITAAPTGSRIDLRSASRAGVSDLGVNAQRIRDFRQTFTKLQPD